MINATQKGLVTGAAILLLSALAYWIKGDFDNNIVLIAYLVYAIGIAWTMIGFHRQNSASGFKAYFQQGFKTYIVVTLIMVCATWLFIRFNPAIRDNMVEFQRQQMLASKEIAAADIEPQLATYRKFILPGYTMAAVLSYLGIGTLLSLLGAVFLNQLNKSQPVAVQQQNK
jgi:hypothetical protein